ncbi:hypothetical protein PCASD_26750 [Puccinia coronata f. sp. avenae]|uniref:Uncharacterized protein n=1 Tax=Puccinia coronata f. sp. avenae TaxID=200324 RepID=A0A2N5RZ49_9BASI|nr:hypothetical protein PCASD_26750 [Puccinia coronata f. sp. avenae]
MSLVIYLYKHFMAVKFTGTSKFTLPALTGRTRLLERCSNSRVQPVVGRRLSDQSKSQLVGQICALVGQCLSDHRSNTAVRAPLELPCSTG